MKIFLEILFAIILLGGATFAIFFLPLPINFIATTVCVLLLIIISKILFKKKSSKKWVEKSTHFYFYSFSLFVSSSSCFSTFSTWIFWLSFVFLKINNFLET